MAETSDNYIRFYGMSDDLIEVCGAFVDEYNSTDETFIVCGALRVRVFYGDNGCWSIAIGQVDEDILTPPFELAVDDYTMDLHVWLRGTGSKAGKSWPATVIREANQLRRVHHGLASLRRRGDLLAPPQTCRMDRRKP